MIRILIVDDKPENLYLLQSMLDIKGFKTIVAKNGAEALGLMRKELPDLIISDILMPVMDGFTLCSECKKDEKLKKIPFVFYTATYTDPKDEEFALSLGADRFILKPQEPDDFIKIINNILIEFKKNIFKAIEVDHLEDSVVLKEYNEVLIRKLEDKMAQTAKTEEESKKYIIRLEKEIIERKKTEEVLHVSEDRYRDLVENSQDLICLHDLEGRILSANPWAAKILGYETDTILQMNIRDFLAPEVRRGVEVYLTRIRKNGTAKGLLLVQTAAGERRIWEYNNTLRTEDVTVPLVRGMARDITERKKAEEELQRSEIKYRSLAENSPDLIARFDRQYRHLYVNPTAAKAGRYSQDAYVGKTITEVGVPEEEARRWEERIRTAFETGQVVDVEDSFETPNGSRNFHTKFVPEFAPDGSIHSVQSIARDITERKEAKEAMLASETKYRELVEQATDGIFIADTSGFLILVNPKSCEILGYTEEELLHLNITDTYPQEEIDLALVRMRDARMGETHQYERRMRRKDGTYFLVEVTLSRLKNGNFQGFVHDITERKQVEEALRLEKENFRHSLDDSPLGVRITTIEGKTIFANKALLDFYGYDSLGELQKTPLKDRYTPESYAQAQKRKRQRERGDLSATDYEISIITKNGEIRHLQVFRKEVLWDGVRQFQIICNDITERKQAEKALQESEEKFRVLVEGMGEGVGIIDKEENFVFANAAAEKIFGVGPGELVGTTLLRFLSPENMELVKKQTNERRKRISSTYEHEIILSGGVKKHIVITATPKLGNNGEFLGTFAIFRDITDRKLAEDALRQSEMKLKALFEVLPIGVSILNVERNIVFVNPAMEKILHLTKDGFIRGDYKNRKYLRPDGTQMPEEEFASVRAIREQRAIHNVETGVLMEDGNVIWTNVNAAPVTFPDWKVVIITKDITERKRIEKALQESIYLLKKSQEIAHLGSWEFDLIKDHLTWSDEVYRIFGISPQEFLATNEAFLDIVHPEDRIAADAAYKESLRQNLGSYDNEHRIICKNTGEIRYVHERCENIRDASGMFIRSVGMVQDITERRMAEDKLRRSEARFRSYFDLPLHGIAITSTEKGWIEVNNRICSILGYDRDELARMTWSDMTHPDDLAADVEHYNRLLSGEIEQYTLDKRFISKDGRVVWTSIAVGCVRELDGNIDYVVAYMEDITERKQAEEALHLEKENFRHSLDDSPLGVRIATIEGNTIYANKTLLDFYGYDSLEELQKTPLKDRYIPESFVQAQKRKQQRERGDLSATKYEISIVRKNGKIRHLQVFRKEVLWDGIRQFQILYDDITERKQAEETLRESEQKVSEALKFNRKILNTSSIGILTYKKSGQCISANSAAAKATGATVAKLMAQNFHEISSWKKSGMYKVAIKALDTGIEQLLDVHLVTTFGKDVWLSLSFSSFDSEGEKHLLVFLTDINERRLAEDEIRKSTKLLEDLHKHLDEIRENERALISREIHDQIGQSLTALKLDLNWMKKYIDTNPEATAKLEGMVELVTGTIKDVQRISSELRPGILDDLGLAAAIEWYCDEFEKRTAIKCSLRLDDSIFGDPRKNLVFFRVLQEAMTNVIRHANASSVAIKLHHTEKGTTLAIHDNGIGITREKVESAKSLGLIGMRERIRQFGGKVNISSGTEQGTKLTIFIPEKKKNVK